MLELSGLTLGIFLLIGVGAGSRRIGLLKFEDRVALNNIIIFICLPSLIFLAARESPLSSSLLIISGIALTISLATIAVGWTLARLMRLDGPIFGAFLLAAGIGNTGYLGYPLTQSFFGQNHLVKAVFYDIFGTLFILFTVGIYFAAKYGHSRTGPWRQGLAYATPNLIGLGLGFATQAVTLPAPINLAISSLAGATTGVIMISIGISLSGHPGRTPLPIAILTVLKLGFMPALALGAIIVLGLPPGIRDVTVLQASMPIALMSFIIGDKYNLDRDFLSGSILASTLLSLFTIPAWQTIATLL